MKGSMQLFLIKEDGTENYLFQNTKVTYYNHGYTFIFYERRNEYDSWNRIKSQEEIEKDRRISEFMVSVSTRNSQYGFSREIARPINIFGQSDLSVENFRPQPVQHESIVRYLTEQEIQIARTEVERRNRQREEALLRAEEERTRERRPWERFRDMIR